MTIESTTCARFRSAGRAIFSRGSGAIRPRGKGSNRPLLTAVDTSRGRQRSRFKLEEARSLSSRLIRVNWRPIIIKSKFFHPRLWEQRHWDKTTAHNKPTEQLICEGTSRVLSLEQANGFEPLKLIRNRESTALGCVPFVISNFSLSLSSWKKEK